MRIEASATVDHKTFGRHLVYPVENGVVVSAILPGGSSSCFASSSTTCTCAVINRGS